MDEDDSDEISVSADMPDYLFNYVDEDEEALGADMPDYLFNYMDDDSSEEALSADMPDYLFKYMDEDDEESVSADMPDYLFKYMDEDEDSVSDSEEAISDDDDDDADDDDDDDDDDESVSDSDEDDEVQLAEYSDLYDLSESEEQVGEPIDSLLEYDPSEESSSESGEYFVLEHTRAGASSEDEEIAVGASEDLLDAGMFENFYSEEAVGDSEEKPLSVGDSFFDINDDDLVQDLASKFGLDDDDEKQISKKDSADEIDLTDADAGDEK